MNESNQAVTKGPGWGIAWGILTIVLGLVAMSTPLISGLAVTLLIGYVLLAAGIAMLIFAFQAPSLGKAILKLLFAALTVVAGLAIVSQPGLALAQLTWLVGIVFVVDGVMGFIVAWNVKPANGWGWMTANALITLALGVMILKGWPAASLVVVGVLVGVRLMFAGLAMLTVGTVRRRFIDQDFNPDQN